MADSVFHKYALVDGINPNLLDNWYFEGGGSQEGSNKFPINQRHGSSYPVASITYDSGSDPSPNYMIDRWVSRNSNLAMSIYNEYVRLKTIATGTPAHLYQILENPIGGRPVTFSALVSRIQLDPASTGTDAGQFQIKLKDASGNDLAETDFAESDSGLRLLTVTYNGSGASVAAVGLCLNNSVPTDGFVNVRACKLEYGARQTLAHRENGTWVLNETPNLTDEYLHCFRFCRILNGTAHSTYYKPLQQSPPFRDTPTYAEYHYTTGGTHYHIYSADLPVPWQT